MSSPTIFTHPIAAEHRVPPDHPERSARYDAVMSAVSRLSPSCPSLEAPPASHTQLSAIHTEPYLTHLFSTLENLSPSGIAQLDGDTFAGSSSLEAALRGAGGACGAVDAVLSSSAPTAFSAMRPPGHHAEPNKAMGFCLLSSAAIAARHAQVKWGVDRVAVLDFDVHHGNGTQAAFWDSPHLIYASSHQMPFYPGTGDASQTGDHANIINLPLVAGDTGETVRTGWREIILPQVAQKGCDLIIISAGFDAHKDDPLGGLQLETEDFGTLTQDIIEILGKSAKIVSLLEGGYNLAALENSLFAHLQALSEI